MFRPRRSLYGRERKTPVSGKRPDVSVTDAEEGSEVSLDEGPRGGHSEGQDSYSHGCCAHAGDTGDYDTPLPSWSLNFSGGGSETINKQTNKPKTSPYFSCCGRSTCGCLGRCRRVSVRRAVQGDIAEEVSPARTDWRGGDGKAEVSLRLYPSLWPVRPWRSGSS